MSMSHGAAGPVDGTSGSRLHPASNQEDVQNQAGLRDHGSGKNGPGADFRAAGTKYEQVRKDGENTSPNAATHDIDSLKQFNAQ